MVDTNASDVSSEEPFECNTFVCKCCPNRNVLLCATRACLDCKCWHAGSQTYLRQELECCPAERLVVLAGESFGALLALARPFSTMCAVLSPCLTNLLVRALLPRLWH